MARQDRKRKPVVPVILLLLGLGGIGIWVGNFRLTGKVVGDGLKFTDKGTVIHWDKDQPIPYILHERGSADISDGSDLRALRNSYASFERVPGASIEFQDMGVTAARRAGYNSADPGDNENAVYWEEDNWEFDPNVLAVTLTVYYTDTGQMLDGDIIFNGDKYQWTTTGEPGRHDIENTMTHELGHFMGLNHNGANAEATMYPAASAGETKKRDLHPSDIEYLQYLHGEGKKPDPHDLSESETMKVALTDSTPEGMPQAPGQPLPVETVKGGCGGGSIAAGEVPLWRTRR